MSESENHTNENLSKQLYDAVLMRMNINYIKELLNKDASPEWRSPCGFSIIHIAITYQYLDYLDLFLNNGANADVKDSNGETPLCMAARYGYVECCADVNTLNNIGYTLHQAFNTGLLRFCEILLNNGLDVNAVNWLGNTALFTAATEGKLEFCKLFIKHGVDINRKNTKGETALYKAVHSRQYECCKFLINQGADANTLNNIGYTLHQAFNTGLLRFCEILLSNGLDVNAVNWLGNTALFTAATEGKLAFCKLFVKHGVDINRKNTKGETALLVAARHNEFGCSEFLLMQRADTSSMNDLGYTLHHAINNNRFHFCELLLNNGLNISAVDKAGNTALHRAAYDGKFEFCKLLVEHGADINATNYNGDTSLHFQIYKSIHNTTGERLQICKYFFEHGAILVELPQNMNNQMVNKHYKSLHTCFKWWKRQQIRKQQLNDIPREVFKRGPDAVDIYFKEIVKSQYTVYRSRICIVGPSGWGKTSLVKSLISGVPKQVASDDRTIGIDQFLWQFDIMKENNDLIEASNSATNNFNVPQDFENHQVSFWDFAGQDIYKGAHSIFFSSARTLFLLCVDLQVCEEDLKNNRNIANEKILQWVRLVFAKQPNAKMLFVGTKVDLVDKHAIQNIKVGLSDGVHEWCDNYSEDIDIRKSSFSENSTAWHKLQDLQTQLEKVKEAVNGEWVITSSKVEDILKLSCHEIQHQIRDRKLGFIMPESYISVLDYLYQIKNDARTSPDTLTTGEINSNNITMENYHNISSISQLDTIFCTQRNLKQKIRRNVHQVDSNETKDNLLDEILELFHDLGEILLFQDVKLNMKKGVVIVDPELMIDLVREIVRHDLCEYLEHSNMRVQLEPHDWKEQLKKGVVYHAILEVLPIWSKLTNGQKLVAKELLHECQVLLPLGVTKLGFKTNVFVPALWLTNLDANCRAHNMEECITVRYGDTHSISHICWEYEFSMHTLPDSFFEQFIVKSYHCDMEHDLRRNSLELWIPNTTSLGLVTFNIFDCNHYLIKIEVASNTQDMAIELMKHILEAVENLLCEYPGVSKSSYYIEWNSNGLRIRHPVNCEFLAGRLRLRVHYNYVDDNLLLWYCKLYSQDNQNLPELSKMCEEKKRLQRQQEDMERRSIKLQNQTSVIQNQSTILQNQEHIVHEINDGYKSLQFMNSRHGKILQFLCQGEINRQLPALWTVELDTSRNKLFIRLLSDISGKCVHSPFQMVLPLRILSKYKNKLKIGENVLSILTHDAIPWKHLDISNINDIPKKIFNLIHGCSLQSYGIIDTDNKSRMLPDESKSFLVDLLKFCFQGFTLDQIPHLSGLVCGLVRDSEHHIWATRNEFAKFGDKITLLDNSSSDPQLQLQS